MSGCTCRGQSGSIGWFFYCSFLESLLISILFLFLFSFYNIIFSPLLHSYFAVDVHVIITEAQFDADSRHIHVKFNLSCIEHLVCTSGCGINSRPVGGCVPKTCKIVLLSCLVLNTTTIKPPSVAYTAFSRLVAYNIKNIL